MNREWPFDDPPNMAVFTTEKILNGTEWIAYVFHDEDDGAWQFHPLKTDESARIVSLRTILDIDSSVTLLADLPLGWKAYRQRCTDDWKRSPNKMVDDCRENDVTDEDKR